ncbi:TPA: ead/Ea22-like family protein [Enterobacter hormaechei]|uniref:ead/Ea22-like family protein n=1 Tax=uncultured Enterobacter sp. TaxID=238202 RepID=UPI000649484B|nr:MULTISPECIES: ead/Ea22-like family protein [Enterobacter cloacae complex]EHF4963738.1 ead/Ea22-like family protein [Enterobacter hormaechei]EHF4977118.1 ead/Ea22-like family protein [Enterobacter hormaechei]EHF4987229.1 ead/Ea22-like family protein [Enterobacter hormaechei]EHF5050770.1 ead/Ea22-like family protein [Enterobacter hormaechei]EKT9354067.1 ead/Ea22-like family protein [Enterobacter hormaechei]
MSNIDKLMEKLKSAALKLNCEQWQTRNGFSGVEVIVKGSVVKGHGCVSYQPVASELVDTKTAKAIALFCPANILALLDELEAKDAQIANLTAERDALREGEMGDAKHSNTRAAADIYFQLVEECEIPAGGSLVEYVSELRERAAADKGAAS